MKENYRRRYYEDHPEDYKRTDLPTYEEKMESETRKGIIKGARLINVRKKADSAMPVVTVLNEGDEVVILGEEDNYYKVRTKDKDKFLGYVLKKYCKEE